LGTSQFRYAKAVILVIDQALGRLDGTEEETGRLKTILSCQDALYQPIKCKSKKTSQVAKHRRKTALCFLLLEPPTFGTWRLQTQPTGPDPFSPQNKSHFQRAEREVLSENCWHLINGRGAAKCPLRYNDPRLLARQVPRKHKGRLLQAPKAGTREPGNIAAVFTAASHKTK